MTLATQPIIDAVQRVSCRAQKSLTIFAPYITAPALSRVLDCSRARTIDVVTTWRSADIAIGVSDTAIYDRLAARGGSVRLLPSLHMKAVIADFEFMFVGSANITSPGLGIGIRANVECGIECEVSGEDAAWFKFQLGRSQFVTKKAYSAFLKHLKNCIPSPRPTHCEEFDWSRWIVGSSKRMKIPEFSNPEEFIQFWQRGSLCNGLDDLNRHFHHDLDLLGLSETAPANTNVAELAVGEAYLTLPLVQSFIEFVDGERYFGAIRAWLRRHVTSNEDIDDATRRLITWTAALCPQYHLDRPNYSSRLRRYAVGEQPPRPYR